MTEFSVKTNSPFMGASRSAHCVWLERPQTAIEKYDVELGNSHDQKPKCNFKKTCV
jgi:hypothetical protein